jgi:hypothetical protein
MGMYEMTQSRMIVEMLLSFLWVQIKMIFVLLGEGEGVVASECYHSDARYPKVF